MSSAQPEAIDLAPKTKPKRKGKGKKTKSKKSKPVVNLGYKDEPVDDQEHADAFTSKLGGKPVGNSIIRSFFEQRASFLTVFFHCTLLIGIAFV